MFILGYWLLLYSIHNCARWVIPPPPPPSTTTQSWHAWHMAGGLSSLPFLPCLTYGTAGRVTDWVQVKEKGTNPKTERQTQTPFVPSSLFLSTHTFLHLSSGGSFTRGPHFTHQGFIRLLRKQKKELFVITRTAFFCKRCTSKCLQAIWP